MIQICSVTTLFELMKALMEAKVPLEYAMATFKKAELYFNWQSNPLCASEYCLL